MVNWVYQMESEADNINPKKEMSWNELVGVMDRVGSDSEVGVKPEEVIEGLSDAEKVNLIADSFRFSVGSLEAQGLYEIYAARKMGVKDPEDTVKLFKEIYISGNYSCPKRGGNNSP